MPESKVTLDGGSKAAKAWGIDLRDISGPKVAPDQCLTPPMAENHHLRVPWILQSEATILVVMYSARFEHLCILDTFRGFYFPRDMSHM